MHISRPILKLAAVLGVALVLMVSAAGTAGAGGYEGDYDGGYEGECDPSHEGVEGYEGYEGYEGCDEVAAPTPTPTPDPTPAPSLTNTGNAGLPQTGGVTMVALATVVAAIGLTVRRLATR